MFSLQRRSSFPSYVGQAPTSSSIHIPAEFIAAASISLVLTISAVFSRAFAKFVTEKRAHVEDYAIIIAEAGFIAFVGLLFAAAGAGLGLHHKPISSEKYEQSLQYSNGLDMVYASITPTVKIAILIQVDRLFSNAKNTTIYWSTRALLLLNFAFYTTMFLVYIFACNPRAKIWDPTVEGKCVSQNAGLIAEGSINITSNAGILFLSLWGVGTMKLTMKRKTMLALALTFGIVACVLSSFRLIYGVKVGGIETFTADIWFVHLWSLAELTSIIICACCPTFPSLYQYTQGKRTVNTYAQSKWPKDKKSPDGVPLIDLESQTFRKSRETSMSRISYQKTTPNASSRLPRGTPSQNTGRTNPYNKPRSNSRPSSRRSQRASSRSSNRISPPTPINLQKTLPRAPIRHISNTHAHPFTSTMHPIPEQPYSHLSHQTLGHDLNISYPPITPSSPTQSHFPFSPTSTHCPLSPTPTEYSMTQTEYSVATTEFSVAQVEDARPMRILPVYFATIKKTVSVRISSHTNLGSPLSGTWKKPNWGW